MLTFLEKNKKKSALAALLLLFRRRKALTLLLFLLLFASFVFVSPSHLLLNFPGGAQAAAGVAWLAGKIGINTSEWGLVGDARDYGDLLAAFRAAKDGGGNAGRGAFLRSGEGTGAAGLGAGSLDFVKGNAKDLRTSDAGGGALPKSSTIAGILNADDADKMSVGVALSAEDLTGEREGLVKSAFAGGFANGAGGAFSNGGFANGAGVGGGSGGSGTAGGTGSVGGVFVSARFFSGTGGSAARVKPSDELKAALPVTQTPPSVAAADGVRGHISTARSAGVKTNISKGLGSMRAVGGQSAFVQLAIGNGRSTVSVAPNCKADNGCPAEFAAMTIGSIYDTNVISGVNTGLLSSSGASTPDVNLDIDAMEDILEKSIREAEQLKECSEKSAQCEAGKKGDYKRMGELQTEITDMYGQVPGACGDNCNCSPCDNLRNKMTRVCDGELKEVIDRINLPCDKPSFCAALDEKLGSATPPTSSKEMKTMCNPQEIKCHESGNEFKKAGCALLDLVDS